MKCVNCNEEKNKLHTYFDKSMSIENMCVECAVGIYVLEIETILGDLTSFIREVDD